MQVAKNSTAKRVSVPPSLTAKRVSVPPSLTAKPTNVPTRLTSNRTSVPTRLTANRTSVPKRLTSNRTSVPKKLVAKPANVPPSLTAKPANVPTNNKIPPPSLILDDDGKKKPFHSHLYYNASGTPIIANPNIDEKIFKDNNLNQKDGIQIFRKKTISTQELYIYKKLEKLNNPNIVKIYRVGDDEVDIEKISTALYESTLDKAKFTKTIEKLKKFLKKNNIVYIDWKLDNFGIIDDTYKLFDFDASGVIKEIPPSGDINEIAPPNYFKYQCAVKAGFSTPLEIDEYLYREFYNKINKENPMVQIKPKQSQLKSHTRTSPRS